MSRTSNTSSDYSGELMNFNIGEAGKTTPTNEETPEFCKRKDINTVDIESKITTHNELIKIGQLMQEEKNNICDVTNNKEDDIYKIKTMSLDELYEYVENKLSKTHYSPEVIYLLFKIQCILIEKINLTKELNNNKNIIIELKKDLLQEKSYIQDLKDTINETTNELDTFDNENNIKIINYEKDYSELKEKYNYTNDKKVLYEKIVCYCLPSLIVFITIYVNNIANYISKYL